MLHWITNEDVIVRARNALATRLPRRPAWRKGASAAALASCILTVVGALAFLGVRALELDVFTEVSKAVPGVIDEPSAAAPAPISPQPTDGTVEAPPAPPPVDAGAPTASEPGVVPSRSAAVSSDSRSRRSGSGTTPASPTGPSQAPAAQPSALPTETSTPTPTPTLETSPTPSPSPQTTPSPTPSPSP